MMFSGNTDMDESEWHYPLEYHSIVRSEQANYTGIRAYHEVIDTHSTGLFKTCKTYNVESQKCVSILTGRLIHN